MVSHSGSTTSGSRRRAILLTCYMTGATSGKNLGVAGYSYDFVAQLFMPLLGTFGEVIPVPEPKANLDAAAARAREAGLEPVHVSFLPLQDMPLATSCPNIAVPAWEFPDVPDHSFDGNPQNDWPATANRCASVWVGGEFTQVALEKSGTASPIQIVPVPTPDIYFEVPLWQQDQATRFAARSYAFPLPQREREALPAILAPPPRVHSPLKRLGKSVEARIRKVAKQALGPTYQWIRKPSQALRTFRTSLNHPKLPVQPVESVDLSGVVYTSIFNPGDGRKNWPDLISAYLLGLKDCADATLVIKLITGSEVEIDKIVRHYLRRGIEHRCKLYFITGYLTPPQMAELARASTYYVQTTKAEGNCLPLMNYLAAARPAITPCHSAIADYFRSDYGFIVDSHAEPAAWPHDRRLRIRTTWGRLVWPSLVQQLQASYHIARHDLPTYYRMAEAGRTKMTNWASNQAVLRRLEQAFATLDQQTVRSTPSPMPLRRAA